MVKLVQTEDGRILYSSDNYKELNLIHKPLKCDHPEKERIPSYVGNGGKWDGICRFYETREHSFPLGFLSKVHKYLNKHNVEVEFIKVDSFKSSLPLSETILSRPYQVAAIKIFFRFKHGILKVPTRGGKTFIASEIIRHVRHEQDYSKILFFVDTSDLFEQAINDISKHLGIPKSHIGQIREKKFELKPITVCTVQTIQSILSSDKRIKVRKNENRDDFNERKRQAKIRKRQLLEYFKQVTFLIVDECHEYSGENRRKILEKFKHAEFKLLISASPFKSENELDNLNLRTVSGDVLYSIPENELKEQGFLAKDKILLFDIEHNRNKNITVTEDDDYREFLEQVITHNQFRNSILVNTIEILRKFGLKTLTLFSRKEHGYFIKSITGDPFISGDMLLKERTFIRTKFLRRKGGVLLASDVFKKGITLPEVQVMLNAGGGLEKSNVVQKKGRVLGTTTTKDKALIIDFIDSYKYFAEHSLNRIEVYEKSVGLDNIIILDVHDKEFYNDLKSVIADWFDIILQ